MMIDTEIHTSYMTYAKHHYSDGEIISEYSFPCEGKAGSQMMLRDIWNIASRSSNRYGSVHIEVWQE